MRAGFVPEFFARTPEGASSLLAAFLDGELLLDGDGEDLGSFFFMAARGSNISQGIHCPPQRLRIGEQIIENLAKRFAAMTVEILFLS